MLERKLFFLFEQLQITAGERRIILAVITLLLLVSAFRLFYSSASIFDDAYYQPVVEEFNRLASMDAAEKRILLSRYEPVRTGTAGDQKGMLETLVQRSLLAGGMQILEEKKTAQPVSLRFDVNTAGKEEWVLLPGIGPATAERIVDYRHAYGLFRNPDELLNVAGLGPVTLERIRMYLVFD